MSEKLAEELTSATDPKKLDEDNVTGDDSGEEEEESLLGGGSTREFFWDKLVLFVSTAIIALTAVDILTELLRGGENSVVCYVPEELNATESQDNFVQSFCSQSIPDSQYLPIFVLIHGVLIGATHFLWKTSFGSHFNYFFSLTKNLVRLREEKTGDYPFRNLGIIKKLQVEFTAYRRQRVFRCYQLKLLIQLLIAVASLLVSFLVFTDFEAEFQCPRNDPSTVRIWPYPNTKVDCISASLRLFWLVRVVDVVLLFLVLAFVLWGLLWSVYQHQEELNIKDSALFYFTTGLDSSFFVPKSPFRNVLQFFRVCCSRRFLEEVRQRFFENRISSDLDFFLMLLYRVDSGLAHTFHEGLVQLEVGALVELDYQLLDSQFDPVSDEDVSEQQDKKEVMYRDKKVKYRYDHIGTGWAFPEGGRDTFTSVSSSTVLAVPDNIRGVVMGLGFRAPGNKLAISLSFGSYGYSDALVRIFKKVGALNFDPAYRVDEKDQESNLDDSYGVKKFRTSDDTFRSADKLDDFIESVGELIYEGGSDIVNPVSYVVVGPIAEVKHIGTAKHILRRLEDVYEDGAVVVIVEPVEIEGENGAKQFYYFTPDEKLFKWCNPKLALDDWETDLKWPPAEPPAVRTARHQTYNTPSKQDSLTKQVNLKCGKSWCKFRIQCYKLYDPNSNEEGGEKDEASPVQGRGSTDTSTKAGDISLPAGGLDVGGKGKGYKKKDVNVEAGIELGVVRRRGGAEEGEKREEGKGEVAEEGRLDREPLVVKVINT